MRLPFPPPHITRLLLPVHHLLRLQCNLCSCLSAPACCLILTVCCPCCSISLFALRQFCCPSMSYTLVLSVRSVFSFFSSCHPSCSPFSFFSFRSSSPCSSPPSSSSSLLLFLCSLFNFSLVSFYFIVLLVLLFFLFFFFFFLCLSFLLHYLLLCFASCFVSGLCRYVALPRPFRKLWQCLVSCGHCLFF